MFKNSRFAFILGVIVLIMAIVLRVRWQYAPPSAGDNIYWIDVVQQSLAENLEPPDIDLTSTIAAALTAPTVEPTTVTPDVGQLQTYTPGPVLDLVTGVQPTLLPSTTGYAVGFLFGERYMVKQYTTTWEPLAGDITLVDGLELINGQLPFTQFISTGTEFVLVYATVNDRGTVDVHEKRLTDIASPGTDITLLTDLPTTVGLHASATSVGSAVLLIEPAGTSRLLTFSAQGSRLAEVPLSQFTAARAIIGDGADWLVFGQTESGLYVEKLSNLGKTTQAVNVTLAKAASPGPAQLMSVARLGDYVALQLTNQIVVMADNLLTVYGDFTFTSNQLHPQLTLGQDQLYLVYDTPVSLTEYQIHLVTLPLAPVAR